MHSFFKASCFFCMLLLSAGVTQVNNNLFLVVAKQQHFVSFSSKKDNITFFQNIDVCFSNFRPEVRYTSTDYFVFSLLQYIRKSIRKLYSK